MDTIIRKMSRADLESCAEILMAVYNNELWQCRWSKETALQYLADYFEHSKFIGSVMEKDDKLIGAIFAHEKVWWNNNEIFIDEMFILPEFQGQGHGSALLRKMEEYVKEHDLAGFTLTTNRYAPAPNFYKKNGFVDCEHILFMAKEC